MVHLSGSIQGDIRVSRDGYLRWVLGRCPGTFLLLSPSLCSTERPPPGRWDAAPRDLLAVRLHLDNGTTLPAAAVRLRWQVVPAGRVGCDMGMRLELHPRVPSHLVTLPIVSRCWCQRRLQRVTWCCTAAYTQPSPPGSSRTWAGSSVPPSPPSVGDTSTSSRSDPTLVGPRAWTATPGTSGYLKKVCWA